MTNQKRAYLLKLEASGGVMYIHPCSKCGSKIALFGYAPLIEGKTSAVGKWQAIIWFCQECNKSEKS